jgi:hypothetical protein
MHEYDYLLKEQLNRLARDFLAREFKPAYYLIQHSRFYRIKHSIDTYAPFYDYVSNPGFHLNRKWRLYLRIAVQSLLIEYPEYPELIKLIIDFEDYVNDAIDSFPAENLQVTGYESGNVETCLRDILEKYGDDESRYEIEYGFYTDFLGESVWVVGNIHVHYNGDYELPTITGYFYPLDHNQHSMLPDYQCIYFDYDNYTWNQSIESM